MFVPLNNDLPIIVIIPLASIKADEGGHGLIGSAGGSMKAWQERQNPGQRIPLILGTMTISRLACWAMRSAIYKKMLNLIHILYRIHGTGIFSYIWLNFDDQCR